MAEGLQFLLKAPSRKLVDELFTAAFKNRGGDTSELETEITTALTITPEEAERLVKSIQFVITKSLYEHGTSFDPSPLIPTSLRAELRDLIVKIINHRLPEWREASLASGCSLPRMVSLDYRIDIKSGSETMSRMSVPTVLVNIKVANPPSKSGEEQQPQSVLFELDKNTISTMLDSLKFVQGQLNSIK